MPKLFRIPLSFLLVASLIGLLLRYHFVFPIATLRYPYWLHAHSHVMFLGWVFNMLNLAYVLQFVPEDKHRFYKTLFWINQVFVIGMLLSFPFQGYGYISIPVSTLHTLVTAVFAVRFIRDSRAYTNTLSRKLAVWSLACFIISAVGPFLLGPLMANGLAHSKWYYFAIYFYLHFQYNGVFTFGVLSLFIRQKEIEGHEVDWPMLRRGSLWLFVSCFPAYLLSVLWASPPYVFHWIGLGAAVAQFMGMVWIIRSGITSMAGLSNKALASRIFWSVAFFALLLKLGLQLVSAHPSVAVFAYENRNLVIAYLHLVLIGFVTFALIAWCIDNRVIHPPVAAVLVLSSGFVFTELTLVTSSALPALAQHQNSLMLFFSLLLFSGFVMTIVMPKK